ncbi:hypothetical protein N0V90_012037 [Kalmusia sp. IMI 367209]|nr:hypothetical protein N0V90_012037 [Kalmusia sp. IMI 367209]
MSRPQNQKPTNGTVNGSGTTQAPSSPAMERWMREKPSDEPWHAQGSQAATSSSSGASTGAAAEKKD